MLQDQSVGARFLSTSLSFLFLLLFLLLLPISETRAAEVTLNLGGNYGNELAGYKIYYKTKASGAPYNGTVCDQGISPIIVPLKNIANQADPTVKLTGLQENTTHYIVATAYGAVGNESTFSNEVIGKTEDYRVDTDGDGITDDQDAFPNDPNEWQDTDVDGVGDNSDLFPDDPSKWADPDGNNDLKGAHTIIIDDGDPQTSYAGTWKPSGGLNPWDPSDPAATSLWGRDGDTYTWTFSPAVSGKYAVSMWWTAWTSRSDTIPVDIEHANGMKTVTINQQINGSRWNGVGAYYFEAGVQYDISIISQPGPASTCADAIKFEMMDDSIIIDDGDPETSYTGTWKPSGGLNPWNPSDPAATSLWGRDGDTYTWTFSPAVSGKYAVSMWWTAWTSRSDTIPVDIEHANGMKTVTINQQVNGSQWNGVGAYYFEAGVQYDITIISQPGPASTCADAIKFEMMVDSIIIDDGDPETSYTGTWKSSGGSNPWDPSDPAATSLWGKDGDTYTWKFTPEISGNYKVSMWWTQWESRSDSIPLEIEHANGTDVVIIDQKIGGGQWNSIGTYYFEAGMPYALTITSQPYPASTCADAVRFKKSPY